MTRIALLLVFAACSGPTPPYGASGPCEPGRRQRPADEEQRRREFEAEWRALVEHLDGGFPAPPPDLLEYPEEWDAPAPVPGAPHPREAE